MGTPPLAVSIRESLAYENHPEPPTARFHLFPQGLIAGITAERYVATGGPNIAPEQQESYYHPQLLPCLKIFALLRGGED